MNDTRLRELRDLYRRDLLDDVVPFWERHGVDRTAGGYFFYLGRDGRRYGDDKPVWLLGRTIWLYATLYATVEQRPAWLDLAEHGRQFLEAHAFAPDGKMYFLLDGRGRPLRMRRYVYSEVFAVLAYNALANATGDAGRRKRAEALFDQFLYYLKTPGLLPANTEPATRPMKGLAPLMCVLCLADAVVAGGGDPRFEAVLDEAIAEIFADFVKPEQQCVLETVTPDGGRVEGPEGRVLNPGHAIEAAWFLLEVARRRGDRDLIQRALPLIDGSFERGWDAEYGGLRYFVDVDGYPATQLEHDMKLWWPHCETLYAALLAYHLTGDPKYALMYEQVHAWTFAHFPDREHGEWYGYLHRDGTVSTDLKGGPWKGPFHVPRAQLLCWKLLEEMTAGG